MTNAGAGFGAADFADLEQLAALERSVPDELAGRLDATWRRLECSLSRVGSSLLPEGHQAALWPWREGEALFPFVWGRIKAADWSEFATHLGLFLSPGYCNVCIDLEKDPLDAGESAETLEQVLSYFSGGEWKTALGEHPDDLQLWTDSRNVVTLAGFEETGFDAFMAANQDPSHPWPKLGYLPDAQKVAAYGEHLDDELEARFRTLAPVYRAMLDSFG